MARSYPIELRTRVVDTYNKTDLSMREVSELFTVGSATVKRWVNQKKKSGHLQPKTEKPRGPKKRLTEEHHSYLKSLVLEQPDITIRELHSILTKKYTLKVSPATIGRTLSEIGFRHKRGLYGLRP